jgi:hypothetical protein
MANCTYQGRIESPRGMGVFSSGLFVVIAGTVAGAALCLLAVFGTPQTILPETARWVLVVMLMALGFAGVILGALLNLPDTRRLTLVVLFATALLCSGFAALMGWFAVSGATNSWL